MAGVALSGVAVLKQYFTHPPLTMDELKALTLVERNELAELAAKDLGLSKTEVDGKTVFVK